MKKISTIYVIVPVLVDTPEQVKTAEFAINEIHFLATSEKHTGPIKIVVVVQGELCEMCRLVSADIIYRQKERLGMWGAIQKALSLISALRPGRNDIVVIAHDDCSVYAPSLFKMAESIASGQNDLVIGRRDRIRIPTRDGDHIITESRKLLELRVNIEFLWKIFHGDETLIKKYALDLQSGIVAWRLGINVPQTKIPNRWTWSAELWHWALTKKLRIGEALIYQNHEIGVSRTTLRDWIKHYQKLGLLDPKKARKVHKLIREMYPMYVSRST
jgi:hypothetical protein